MSQEGSQLARSLSTGTSGATDQSVSILAVGEPTEWRKHGRLLPSENGIAFASFDDVTGILLGRICPTVIMSPVLAHRFDCIDLATVLHQLDFRGRYRAIASDMPDPEMIEREIKHLCPHLNFAVLQAS